MFLKKRAHKSHADVAAEFDSLMREHVPALYRAAYRWTGAVDRAEDLVQELLARLFPKLDELRGLDKIRPWALRVMYRIFVDQVRRQRSSPVQFGAEAREDNGEEEGQEFIDPTEGPAELLEQNSRSGAWSQRGSRWERSIAWYCRCTTSRITAFPSCPKSWVFRSAP